MKITLEFDNVTEMHSELSKLMGLGPVAATSTETTSEKKNAEKKEAVVKNLKKETEAPKTMTMEEAKAKAISFKIPPAKINEIVAIHGKEYNAEKFINLKPEHFEGVLADIEKFAKENPDQCRK